MKPVSFPVDVCFTVLYKYWLMSVMQNEITALQVLWLAKSKETHKRKDEYHHQICKIHF